MSEETEPASVERESAEVLSSEEGRDGLLAPGHNLHRHRLLPHAGDGQAVAVDVQQSPDREVNGESSEVATNVMIVEEESEVPARTQAERQAAAVLGQALLVRRVTTQLSQSGQIWLLRSDCSNSNKTRKV